MKNNYHINVKTGNVNICRAKPGKCPLKNQEGQPALHFENKDDAIAYNERELGNTHKPLSSVQKPRKAPLKTITEEENQSLTHKMIAEHNNMLEKLNDKERHTLGYYSFTGSSSMNRILHNRIRDNESEESIELDKEHIQRLDKIIKNFGINKDKKTLYRYIALDKKVKVNEFLDKNFQKGEEYTDSGFMSTTEDLAFIAAYAKKHSRNKNFIVLEIETNKGISLQKSEESIGHLQSFEKERLLPRDMKFKVKEQLTGKVKIDESRQKLMEQFNGYRYADNGEGKIANNIPAKSFQIVKLIDIDEQ